MAFGLLTVEDRKILHGKASDIQRQMLCPEWLQPLTCDIKASNSNDLVELEKRLMHRLRPDPEDRPPAMPRTRLSRNFRRHVRRRNLGIEATRWSASSCLVNLNFTSISKCAVYRDACLLMSVLAALWALV